MFRGEAKSEKRSKNRKRGTGTRDCYSITQPIEQFDWSVAYRDNNLISAFFNLLFLFFSYFLLSLLCKPDILCFVLLKDLGNNFDQFKDISCFSWAERRQKDCHLLKLHKVFFFLWLKAKQVFFPDANPSTFYIF